MKHPSFLLDQAESYFDVLNNSNKNNLHVKCRFCGDDFHCERARLPYHLAKLANGGVRPCPSVPDDIQVIFAEPLSQKRKMPPTDPTTSAKQMRIDDQLLDANRRQADRKWAEFVYAEAIPFTKLRSPFLLDALRANAKVPGYCPPGPKALAGKLLDDAVASMKASIQSSKFRNSNLTGNTDDPSLRIRSDELRCLSI